MQSSPPADDDLPDATTARLIKLAHDPRRPALSTADAADRLGMSRQAVVQAIQRGTIEGYGIAGDSRTRWYVPLDVVKARERVDVNDELKRLRSRNRELEDALAVMRNANEKQRQADLLLREALELGRQAQKRAEEAWAASSEAAEAYEDFVTRRTIPSNVADT
jgi:biotin operon repressor